MLSGNACTVGVYTEADGHSPGGAGVTSVIKRRVALPDQAINARQIDGIWTHLLITLAKLQRQSVHFKGERRVG